ncbi:MAG: NAD(P)H-quinone oxidoreductase [Propionibacteriaceae bacterium]|jgi:putative PIG3 family NAD(P)H quinone oxidoreductase|nr:NAD(P)H-quinone oxidoreductase [Micropruina sp.]HBX81491.1 NAD(P)H-quinone oxidoreductase [Propionibacteriaceae bacterium]
MRAVVVTTPGEPDVMRIDEVPTPVARPGQVLIRTVASGVNRADLLQRRGFYPPPPGESDIIGLEASGTIAAIGEGVHGWTIGDPCVALLAGGGYAEYVVVPAGQAIRPPAGVDLVTAGGLLEVAATVLSNFDHVRLQPGERVLVHGGAGGIGTFALPYAVALGCPVATTAGSPEKLALCRTLGAAVAVDYHGDWAAEIRTQFGSPDVILDIMGAKYLEPNVALLAPDGRLVIIGLQGGRKGTLDIGGLLSKRGTVTATSLRYRPTAHKVAITQAVADRVWPLIEAGRIPLPPERRFAFADVAAAHIFLDSGEATGKVLLVHEGP